MKNLISFISVLLVLFLSNCSENKNNNPLTVNSSGNIGLRIDKSAVPSDVVLIRATLERSGFSEIQSEEVISDSSTNSTDMVINNITVGTWNLNVEAFNSSSVVIYQGSTSIDVASNNTTFVSLILSPKNNDVGSIHISIIWENSLSTWNDYVNNPILTTTNKYYDEYGILEPKVLYLNGQYKMWCLGLGGGAASYGLYAESIDGNNWQSHYKNQPIIFPGSPGTWDALAVQPGAIIFENDVYKMYYTGFTNQNGNWNIGLATSSDGIQWNKYPEPILNGTENWEFQLSVNTVIHNNNTYYLFYTGRSLPVYKIGVATSSDGINFTRYSGNPILISTENWEGSGVSYPSVIFEKNQFKMVYMNASSVISGFGLAYSVDGLNWTKDSSNPFYTNQNSANNWAEYKIAYPNFIKLSDEYRIYYSGIQNMGEHFRTGFLESPF